MKLSMPEKIKVIAGRRNMSMTDIAHALGQSRQNVNNKIARDNFTVKDLEKLATVLDCTFSGDFTMNDTGERI